MMDYKKALEERIEMKMSEYYPSGNHLKTRAIVRERALGTVFKWELEGGEQLFVKTFDKDVLAERAEMWKRLSEHRDEVLIPRILDILEDMNAVVMEGVKGRKLSSILVSHSFPLIKNQDNLYLYVEQIGRAIGKLQTFTAGKPRKLRELKEAWVNRVKLEPSLKKIIGNEAYSQIYRRIETTREKEMMTVRVHGEILPHNILVQGNKPRFIDFQYYEGFCFEDPISFSVGLELTQRVPHFGYNLFDGLNKRFFEAYKESSPCEVDKELWDFFRLMWYCFLLEGYKHWKRYSPVNHVVSVVDSLYLRKKIKQTVTEIGL